MLTHWGRYKVNGITQTTFSSAFFWTKMFDFRLQFHWSLFLRVQLTLFKHWFWLWLGAVQATSHYLNQWWLVYRRIYASLGPNELKVNLFSQYGNQYDCLIRHAALLAFHRRITCIMNILGFDGDTITMWKRWHFILFPKRAANLKHDGFITQDYGNCVKQVICITNAHKLMTQQIYLHDSNIIKMNHTDIIKVRVLFQRKPKVRLLTYHV